MKLSTRARYALRAMVVIARHSDAASPMSLEKVAKATRISRRYLEQLAMSLKGAALLRSVSGRKGGYSLARPAEQISIGQIVEASIGPINVVECVGSPGICIKADLCECRLLYMLINRGIKDVLNRHSLADLADRDWLRKLGPELAEEFRDVSDLEDEDLEGHTGCCPVC